MSSNYWQTEKRRELSGTGKTVTVKVEEYLELWRSRCYSDDIPDEVPKLIEVTMRVPSYKALAISILKNDFSFKSCGFSAGRSDLVEVLRREKKPQKDLWD